ncbi:hypothetical protein [Streptomyces sp. Inha503]|uniref:hypothetical protein n=1 Tax=Streptomyces sp. Inha503 TaxID=3383314 RepID=UPI0039A175CF
MPFTGDQESVGALGTDCAYPSFGERVGPWALRRSRDDGCAVAGEDGVEGGGELAVPVPDEEPEASGPVAEVHEQVAGELRDPPAGRAGGDAQDMDTPGGDLHNEEDVKTLEEDGVHVHEIASEQCVSLRAQEGTPGLLACSLRCGRQTGAAQDAPDRSGGHPMAKPSQLTLDPDVSPGRVLSRQALDERRNLFCQRWPTRSDRCLTPLPAHQTAVPGRQRPRGDQPIAAQGGWQVPCESGEHGTISP